MTTPERPSLADTLARIEAVLAEGRRCTVTAQRRDVGSTGPFTAERCTRDALPGTYTCDLHTQPGGILPITDTVADATNAAELGRLWEQAYGPPGSASVDDEATAEVLRIVQDDFARHEREYLYGLPLDVRPRGGITENGKVLPWSPYLQPALDEVARQSAAKPRHLPGPPGPTCPGCAARDARPGWLARALNRLFGGAS